MSALERRLYDAAAEYPFPPTPDVAVAVVQQLPARRRSVRRQLAIALLALVVALGALFGFSSGARSAVLDLLDAIPGVRIERVEELPPSRLLPAFDFGRPATLEAAQRRAGFPVRLPSKLGRPDEVYFDRDPDGSPVVTVRYDSKLVLTEWRSTAVLFYKLAGRAANVERIEFDGHPAVWMEGPGDHAVFYLGANANEYSREARLAGHVLVWQEGEIGYRLEARVSRGRAMELARSLEP